MRRTSKRTRKPMMASCPLLPAFFSTCSICCREGGQRAGEGRAGEQESGSAAARAGATGDASSLPHTARSERGHAPTAAPFSGPPGYACSSPQSPGPARPADGPAVDGSVVCCAERSWTQQCASSGACPAGSDKRMQAAKGGPRSSGSSSRLSTARRSGSTPSASSPAGAAPGPSPCPAPLSAPRGCSGGPGPRPAACRAVQGSAGQYRAGQGTEEALPLARGCSCTRRGEAPRHSRKSQLTP